MNIDGVSRDLTRRDPQMHERRKPRSNTSIVNPGSANAFVFINERGNSINDGFFVVDMVDTGAQAALGNIPANYHNGCTSISVADGHVEGHKWLDRRTEMGPFCAREPVANGPDIAWLQEHCCSQK